MLALFGELVPHCQHSVGNLPNTRAADRDPVHANLREVDNVLACVALHD